MLLLVNFDRKLDQKNTLIWNWSQACVKAHFCNAGPEYHSRETEESLLVKFAINGIRIPINGTKYCTTCRQTIESHADINNKDNISC